MCWIVSELILSILKRSVDGLFDEVEGLKGRLSEDEVEELEDYIFNRFNQCF